MIGDTNIANITDATGIWPRVMIGVMALGQSLAHHLTK